MKAAKTIGRFGYKLMGGADEDYPTNAIVQVSAAEAVISAHLMTPGEIDHFIDTAHADLDKVRQQAKAALALANARRA
jgi:hypothetical protein